VTFDKNTRATIYVDLESETEADQGELKTRLHGSGRIL
jgi:hypothetical protein